MGKIFLSYRRDGGEQMAALLYRELTHRGYSVFYDIESLKSGPFDTRLLKQIEEADDVLLILPQGGLDRCKNEGDWVRQEIAHAIQKQRNIVPVMLRGFEFPSDLPDDISNVKYYNGVSFETMDYLDAKVDKLASYLQSKPAEKQAKSKAGAPIAKTPARKHNIAVHEHVYRKSVIAPTCTAMGYTLYECECGDEYRDNYTQLVAHSYNKWVDKTRPTCTAEGTGIRRCTVCGYSEERKIPAYGHNWVQYTEGAETNRYQYCSRCGERRTVRQKSVAEKQRTLAVVIAIVCSVMIVSSLLGVLFLSEYGKQLRCDHHDTVVTVDPTCTVDGYCEYTCTKCNRYKKEVIQASGHDSIEYVIDVPTHTDDGLAHYQCTVCNVEYDGVLYATGSLGIEYKYNKKSNTYSVAGIGSCTDTEVYIAACIDGVKVVSVQNRAFKNSSRIVSVYLPEGIETVGNRAFEGCSQLKSVTLSQGITKIGNFAFANCRSLEQIEIPQGVEKLQMYTFYMCQSLKTVTLPSTLEKIDAWCFLNCSSLEHIYYQGAKALWRSCVTLGGGSFVCTPNFVVHCKDGDVDKYDWDGIFGG